MIVPAPMESTWTGARRLQMAGPAVGADPAAAADATFNAQVDREVAARIQVREQEHATALTAATEQGARGAVLSTLDGMIAGNAGDDLAASQFREKIRDLKFELMSGDKRPAAELGAEAVRLNEARIQGLAATSADTEGEQLAEVHADNRGGYQTFAGAYMGALFNESKRLGESLDGEKLTGSPEMEYASSLLDKPGMRDEYQRLSAEAGPRARVVPMPLSMLRPDAMFAETRAAAVVAGDLRREPTYRRDALVPFYRPNNVLAGLGVPNPIIDNDITLPRLSDSIAASWRTEVQNAVDDSLAVVSITTSPKRLVTRDSLSFMLLAGADAQFGHEALVISEMSRAHEQRKEAAVYGGAVSNGPTGITGTTGVTTVTALTVAITYDDVLDIPTALAALHLPVENAKFLISVVARQVLTGVQKFASGGATVLNDTAFREIGSGMAEPGEFAARPMGMMAGHPTFVSTHIATAGTGNTVIYFCLWEYVWCVDYGTAFLTIDDVSNAGNGRTLLTMNTFHDVAVRFPAACAIRTFDAII